MASKGTGGRWALGGAVGAGILSSACCRLPLLLLVFGASAAGLSAFFDAWRTLLLVVTGLFPATGFHLAYFRKPRCRPGAACGGPDPRARRPGRIGLWAATVFVLAFALFPGYAGALLCGAGASPSPPPPGAEVRAYRVEGMTCEACAAGLGARLRELPGILEARVRYDAKRLEVTFSGEDGVAAVLEAIRAAGYRARRIDGFPAAGDPTTRKDQPKETHP